jgi:hypothetical protein
MVKYWSIFMEEDGTNQRGAGSRSLIFRPLYLFCFIGGLNVFLQAFAVIFLLFDAVFPATLYLKCPFSSR